MAKKLKVVKKLKGSKDRPKAPKTKKKKVVPPTAVPPAQPVSGIINV